MVTIVTIQVSSVCKTVENPDCPSVVLTFAKEVRVRIIAQMKFYAH